MLDAAGAATSWLGPWASPPEPPGTSSRWPLSSRSATHHQLLTYRPRYRRHQRRDRRRDQPECQLRREGRERSPVRPDGRV